MPRTTWSDEQRRAQSEKVKAAWARKSPEQRAQHVEAIAASHREANAARRAAGEPSRTSVTHRVERGRRRRGAADATGERPRITLAEAVREAQERSAGSAAPARAVKGSRDARQAPPAAAAESPATVSVRVQPGTDGPAAGEALAITSHAHGQATVLVSFPVESLAAAIGRELAAVLPAPAPALSPSTAVDPDEVDALADWARTHHPQCGRHPVLAHADGEALEIIRLLVRIAEHRRDSDEGTFAHQQELFRTACAKAMRYRQDHPEMFA